MSEPPRPPGDGTPPDPTTPLPYGGDPASGYNSPPPPDQPQSPAPPAFGSAAPPPSSGAGGYPPPSSGAGGYPPPSSGAGGYPTGGGAPPPSGPPQSGPPQSGPPQSGPPAFGSSGQGPAYGAPSYGTPGYGAPGYGAPGQGGYGGPPTGYPAGDDRTWVLLAHFGGAVAMFISGGWLGWVPPLIAFVAKGNQSPLVRAHAATALNFQLLWSVVALAITVVSTCLSVIIIGVFGFLLLIIPWLVGTICGIIAGVKALNGEPYSYPGAPNWVK